MVQNTPMLEADGHAQLGEITKIKLIKKDQALDPGFIAFHNNYLEFELHKNWFNQTISNNCKVC